MNKNISNSKGFVYFILLTFIFLVTAEALPVNSVNYREKEGMPIVRVKRRGKRISAHQVERFMNLFEEGKRLIEEEFDYEGAIAKFTEALRYTPSRKQRADVYFYLSLAFYAISEVGGQEKFIDAVENIIELDYNRELDRNICPRMYIERYEEIKREYGALKVISKPLGADVFINGSRQSSGNTPLTIGYRAGEIMIQVGRGNKKKEDKIIIIAGKEIVSPEFELKGRSYLIYILGGLAAVGGVAIALLAGGGGSESLGAEQSVGLTTGSIEVNSTPTGADVYIQGVHRGVTNTTVMNLEPGPYELKLVRENYEDHVEEVRVVAGQTEHVSVTLEKNNIKVTNPTKNSYWIRGKTVDIEWEVPDSSGTDINTQTQLMSGDNIGQGSLNSLKNRARRTGLKFHNWMLGRRNGEDLASLRNVGSDPQISIKQNRKLDSRSMIQSENRSDRSSQTYKLYKDFPRLFPTGRFISHESIPHNTKNEEVKPLWIGSVRIELFKGNNSVKTIVAKTDNDGKHRWTVPSSLEYGFEYKVRVVSQSDTSIYGESDEFKITIPEYEYVAQWGTEGTREGQFILPTGIAVSDSGFVFVTDYERRRVQSFSSNGNFLGLVSVIESPNQIAVDSAGDVYVAEEKYFEIFSVNGGKFQFVDKYKSTRNGYSGIAVNSKRDIYISNQLYHRISKCDSKLNWLKDWGGNGQGKFEYKMPSYLAVDSKNNLYVIDNGNKRIVKYDSSDNYVLEWKLDRQPWGIAIDSRDIVFVTMKNHVIYAYDSDGNKLLEWGSEGRGHYKYSTPRDIAVDKSGYLYILDQGNHRIVKYRQKQ